jgi:probable rRNA maturation factor
MSNPESMIHLDIAESVAHFLDEKYLLESARAALIHQNAGADSDLSLVITGDARLHELNRDFRGIDAPTDVLAFSGDLVDPETGRPYLGDVVISYAQAESQAREAGHSIQEELRLLIVHGVLHLLNYDHLEPAEKARMWSAQAQILASLGSTAALPD